MSVAYRKPVSGLFETLLGSARPVSAYWNDMFEPWQPPVEKTPTEWKLPPLSFYDGSEVVGGLAPASGNNAIVSQDSSGFGPPPVPRLLSDGTEILSDALPDPVLVGQRYAAGGSSSRGSRRGGAPPEGPAGEIVSTFYRIHREALRELEPNNRKLITIRSPDWRPTQRDVDEMYRELLEARQRVPGAIDTKESGIGIGRFATESISARSPSRDFTILERAEINRIGIQYGCHTCGSRDPGTTSGNFILDHQRASRLNPMGEAQHLFPQCLSCSSRQGGLIAQSGKGPAMKLFKACRPPNHQIVICDPTSNMEVPDWEKGVPWVATDTCILCMCMIDFEGETNLTLGPGKEVGAEVDHAPVFDGILKTPGRRIVLETVWHDPVLQMATAGTETRVRIWTNRLITPDKVLVGID